MKTQKTQNHALLLKISLILSLFALVACESDKSSSSNQAVTEIKTPEVDIHTAVISNDIEAINQHIKAGSDLNAKDPFGGSSPLMSAALFGKKEIALLLIQAGVNLNFKNNDGSTALHTAAFFCRLEIVKILLDNGIDKSIENNAKITAYGSVAGEFQPVKPIYDMLAESLAPFGLQLDYDYLKATRPVIAEILK